MDAECAAMLACCEHIFGYNGLQEKAVETYDYFNTVVQGMALVFRSFAGAGRRQSLGIDVTKIPSLAVTNNCLVVTKLLGGRHLVPLVVTYVG